MSLMLGVLDGALFGYSVTTETGEGMAAFDVRTVGVLTSIWSLATFVPVLAVSVRRLHDTGRSGWWMLILLVPLVGLIARFVSRGERGTNAHGPDPLGAEAAGGLQ